MSVETIIIAGTLGGGLIAAIAMYPALKAAPFAYGNARVRAAYSKLISESEFKALASEPYKEILYQLEKKGYSEILSLVDSNFREEHVQQKLRSESFKSLKAVKDYVPKKYSKFFSVVQTKHDVEFITTVLRSKVNDNYSQLLLDALLVEGKFFSQKDIEKINSMNLEEFVFFLKKTPYHKIVQDHLDELKKGNTKKCESQLTRLFYSHLRKESKFDPVLIKFSSYLIDIHNIKSSVCNLKSNFIIGGSLQKNILDELNTVDDSVSVAKILDKTHYGKFMNDVKSDIDILKAIYRFERSFADSLKRKNPLSINSALAYLIHKELELRNIRILLKLNHARFSPDEIKSAII